MGKEGYLPKKESKTGDETEVHVPQESIMMENVDQTVAKKDPALKSLCNLKRRKKAAAGIIIVCWARIRKRNKFGK